MARNGIEHVGVIVARSARFPVMLNEKDDMTLDLFSEQVAAETRREPLGPGALLPRTYAANMERELLAALQNVVPTGSEKAA